MCKEQLILDQIQALAPDDMGIADLRLAASGIKSEYGDDWDGYTRAISLAVFFPRQIINQVVKGPTLTYMKYYDIVNARLDNMALRLSNDLERLGYRAFPVPASQETGAYKLASVFSHRLAAYWSGLGWIGKNGSIIHPEVGPRLRLVTILTDAPLTPGKPLDRTCPENCRACQTICPAGAIKGVAFAPGQPLEERLDAAACKYWLHERRNSFGKEVCGMCLAVCPVGRDTPAVEQ